MKKIYVWDGLDLGTYYNDGILVVVADNIKEARELAIEKLDPHQYRIEKDYYSTNKINNFLTVKPSVHSFDVKKSKVIAYHSGSD